MMEVIDSQHPESAARLCPWAVRNRSVLSPNMSVSLYKVHFFASDLPHSDASYVRAYPAATAEAWIDGHVHAFSFFGTGAVVDSLRQRPVPGVADRA